MDSEENSSSEGRKKRPEEGIEWQFDRSKRTQRTPMKHRNEQEGKLDLLLNMMGDMGKCQKEI